MYPGNQGIHDKHTQIKFIRQNPSLNLRLVEGNDALENSGLHSASEGDSDGQTQLLRSFAIISSKSSDISKLVWSLRGRGYSNSDQYYDQNC